MRNGHRGLSCSQRWEHTQEHVALWRAQGSPDEVRGRASWPTALPGGGWGPRHRDWRWKRGCRRLREAAWGAANAPGLCSQIRTLVLLYINCVILLTSLWLSFLNCGMVTIVVSPSRHCCAQYG